MLSANLSSSKLGHSCIKRLSSFCQKTYSSFDLVEAIIITMGKFICNKLCYTFLMNQVERNYLNWQFFICENIKALLQGSVPAAQIFKEFMTVLSNNLNYKENSIAEDTTLSP